MDSCCISTPTTCSSDNRKTTWNVILANWIQNHIWRSFQIGSVGFEISFVSLVTRRSTTTSSPESRKCCYYQSGMKDNPMSVESSWKKLSCWFLGGQKTMVIPSYRSRQLMQISRCRLDTLTNIRLLHLMSEIQETLAFDPTADGVLLLQKVGLHLSPGNKNLGWRPSWMYVSVTSVLNHDRSLFLIHLSLNLTEL